jgi:hypothetical protein
LTPGLSGPNPRPNGPRDLLAGPPPWLAGRLGLKSVQPVALLTRVYERRGRPRRRRKVVEDIPPGRPAMWLGQLAATCCVTTSAKSVELSHGPINTPLSMEIRIHTPLHGNSTCKALIHNVVARHSLVWGVARL